MLQNGSNRIFNILLQEQEDIYVEISISNISWAYNIINEVKSLSNTHSWLVSGDTFKRFYLTQQGTVGVELKHSYWKLLQVSDDARIKIL